MMDTFTSSYHLASDAQRETWWNTFKFKFQYKQKYETQIIKVKFAQTAAGRMLDYMYREAPGNDEWMNDTVRAGFDKWRESDEFKAKSAQKKKNRCGEAGKAEGPHTLRRGSMADLVSKMSEGGLMPPSVPEVAKKAKTSKKGNIISSRMKKIFDSFLPTKKKLQEAPRDVPVRRQRDVLRGSRGAQSKDRVYGTGSARDLFYDRPLPRHSSAGETSTGYTPSILVRLSRQREARIQELASRREQLAAQHERLQSVETMLLNSQPPPTCRDPMFDGGSDPRWDGGDGTGGMMSGPPPLI